MLRACRVKGGEVEKKLRAIESSIRSFHMSLKHAVSHELADVFFSVRKVLSAVHNQDGQGSHKACYCGQGRGCGPALTCNECKDWVHIECLPANTKTSRKFVCPLCVGKSEVNRPTHAELRALLEAARQLHAVVPEEAELEAIVKHYQQWHAHVTGLLDGHTASRLVGGDPSGLLPNSVVDSILKQTVMVSVDSSALQERVLDHKKCEEWRLKVRDLLLQGEKRKHSILKCRREEVRIRWNEVKPTIEELQDLINESSTLRMDHQRDAMMCSAMYSISSCRQWAIEGRSIEALLAAHAGEPIAQVPAELLERTKSHIAYAQQIQLHVDPDVLEYLVHQSTPYCLCKQTNEIDRPMLACENEEKCPVLWYHHECVGLDAHSAPPPGYKCPHCCGAEGLPYPYDLPKKYAVDLVNQYGVATLFGDIECPVKNESKSDVHVNGGQNSFHESSPVVEETELLDLDMGQFLANLAVQWGSLSPGDRIQELERLENKMVDERKRLEARTG